MKTFVKALLLILLAAAIVLGTAWYLLEYDTDFTHDLLLEGARFFEKNNQHVISTWLYDAAYKYGHSIEEISLELADYYLSVGNLAKVEETLTRAIRDGGGVEIYIALSKAFVMQDKLLDALQLIEDVQDPTVRNQLALLRPAAPTPDIAPGLHNEYLSLNFQTVDGNAYVSKEPIPSTQKDLHTAPISLSTGETVLFALTVGENGLVSPLTEHRYIIKGVVESVTFADKEMEKAIRKAAGIPTGVPVYTNDLWEVKSLVIPAEARNYSDLKYLPYLESLTVTNAQDSLTYIDELEALKTLTVKDTAVDAATLQSILHHTALSSLTLRNCGIASLTGFEVLKELTYLDLGKNTLNNLTPLSALTKLQVLLLDQNAVVALNALEPLKNLQQLDLFHNSITNVTPLGSLTSLRQLNLSTNLLSNIEPIGKITSLTYRKNGMLHSGAPISYGQPAALPVCISTACIRPASTAQRALPLPQARRGAI